MQFTITKVQSGNLLSRICDSSCSSKLSDLLSAVSRGVSTRLPCCHLIETFKKMQWEGKLIPSSTPLLMTMLEDFVSVLEQNM